MASVSSSSSGRPGSWPWGSGSCGAWSTSRSEEEGSGLVNATFFVPLVGITFMVFGLAGVGAAAWRSHKNSSRLDFIRSLGSEAELYAEAAPVVERVQAPLVNRIFGPVVNGLRRNLSRLYPASEIDNVHADLLKAGLTGSVRAEEFV